MCLWLPNWPSQSESLCTQLTSLTSREFSKWRNAPRGIRSVLQSVSWCRPARPSSRRPLPSFQHTSAHTGDPVIFVPTVCFKLIHFIFYVFPYFFPPPHLRNASFASCIFCSFSAPLGSHLASFDHELLRLLNACCSCWSMEWEKYVVGGGLVLFFKQFVCSTISLKFHTLYGTCWALRDSSAALRTEGPR